MSSKTNGSKCSVCGEIHNGWPALAFKTPEPYHELTAAEKQEMTQISDDFCIITYEDQTDRFIRVVIKVIVNDAPDDLEYGVWVSLGERNFNEYSDNFSNDHFEAQYFRWLSNVLPDYPDTTAIPVTVVAKGGSERPEFFPHKDFDHDFVRDFYSGISKAEAERRIHNF